MTAFHSIVILALAEFALVAVVVAMGAG